MLNVVPAHAKAGRAGAPGLAICPPTAGVSSDTPARTVPSLSYLEMQATQLRKLVLPFSVEEDKSAQLPLLSFAEQK